MGLPCPYPLMKRLIALFTLLFPAALLASQVEVEWSFAKKLPPVDFTSQPFQPAKNLKIAFPLGQSHTENQTRAVPFASEFAPPTPMGDGTIAVVPATPLSFDTEAIGYQLQIHAEQVGAQVRLVGTLLMREAAAEQGVFGEDSGPIHADVVVDGKKQRIQLTPNTAKMARVKSAESRFQINALPGKSYTITLAGPNGPVTAKVRCRVET